MHPHILAACVLLSSLCWSAELVQLQRVPEQGLRPRAVVDAAGNVHCVWLRGSPKACDIRYARRTPTSTDFGPATTVNSEAGAAVALGSVRGAQLAVDGDGRAHVLWLGSSGAKPRPGDGTTPLLYSRQFADGSFAPQRNLLIAAATGLDGGGAIACGPDQTVWVFWHASAGTVGEANRAAYALRSRDGGATFAAESRVLGGNAGACACCEMAAAVDARGGVTALLRIAQDAVQRDQTVAWLKPGGTAFTGAVVSPWKTPMCPMSSAAAISVGARTWASWESSGQVFWSELVSGRPRAAVPAPGNGTGRKHPALAIDDQGRVCLVWTEGTAWQRGGSLHWQVWDADGKPVGAPGSADGVAAWSLGAVVAQAAGGFTILY